MKITIYGKTYHALINTVANLSLIDSNIKDFRKCLLKNPIEFSTITKKDAIKYEVSTETPEEFNLTKQVKNSWRMTEFKGRKYNFKIGTDILNHKSSRRTDFI